MLLLKKQYSSGTGKKSQGFVEDPSCEMVSRKQLKKKSLGLKTGQSSMPGNSCHIHYRKANSPQQEDASGRQVSVDMWAFHSSVLDRGCLHHCRLDTHQWPHYDPHYRRRGKREEKECNLSLPCLLGQWYVTFLMRKVSERKVLTLLKMFSL